MLKNFLLRIGSFPYYLHSRNLSYRDLHSSFTLGFCFPVVSLEASKLQSHDLGNTGTDGVTRIYSTKGQNTEQSAGRLQCPALHETL